MGELAPVVEIGPASFAVLMRTGARAEVKRAFEQVQPGIRLRLVNERRGRVVEDLLHRLQGGGSMKIDEAALARVSAPEGEPGAGEGGK